MPTEISLKAAVNELEKVTSDVTTAAETAPPKEKKRLLLKVKALKRVRKELAAICRGPFIVVPPSGGGSSSKS